MYSTSKDQEVVDVTERNTSPEDTPTRSFLSLTSPCGSFEHERSKADNVAATNISLEKLRLIVHVIL